VTSAVRTHLADAADEPTFGRQEPAVSFRAARGKSGGKRRGAKRARAGSKKRPA
jgi:hypothetical protein